MVGLIPQMYALRLVNDANMCVVAFVVCKVIII